MKILNCLLMGLTLAACQQNNSTEVVLDEVANDISQHEFRPPFEDFNVPFKTLLISTKKDTTISLESGSYIKIPKKSFVDVEGNLMEEVNIQFREFKNVADIFLSGIPMVFNDKDSSKYFESAAMCEIRSDEGVRMVANANIEIGLATNKTDEDYLLYAYSDSANVWKQIGSDSIAAQYVSSNSNVPAEAISRLYVDNDVLEQIKSTKPIQPIRYQVSDDRLFSLDFENPDNFPELAQLNNLKFRVADGFPFNKKDVNNDWYFVEVAEHPRKGLYTLKLTGVDLDGKRLDKEYVVQPAYQQKEFANAMKDY